MKKFIVETYYTCTFKTVHTLSDLNDKELSKIDERNDGNVEIIDVKLNNRKTKKIGEKKEAKNENVKVDSTISKKISGNLSRKPMESTNIREVTLFPMNQNAQDLMMSAPSNVETKQLQELSIKLDIKKN